MTTKEKAGDLILQRKRLRGLSYESFADECGTNCSTLKRIVKNANRVRMDTLIKILDKLGFDIEFVPRKYTDTHNSSRNPRESKYQELFKFIIYVPLMLESDHNRWIVHDCIFRMGGCAPQSIDYLERQIEYIYDTIKDSPAKRYADLLVTYMFTKCRLAEKWVNMASKYNGDLSEEEYERFLGPRLSEEEDRWTDVILPPEDSELEKEFKAYYALLKEFQSN